MFWFLLQSVSLDSLDIQTEQINLYFIHTEVLNDECAYIFHS